MMIRATALFWCAVFAWAPASATGQTLRVTVVDGVATTLVSGATVEVRANATWFRRGRTADDGSLELAVQPDDTLFVGVYALGYVESGRFVAPMDAGDIGEIVIVLTPQPIPLEGVNVEAEAREPQRPNLVFVGFYERQARGHGTFLDPEALSQITAVKNTDYFRRIPNVHMYQGREPMFRRGGSGIYSMYCLPAIVLDGIMIREADRPRIRMEDVVPARDIEAIEAYPGPASVPARYRQYSTGCGLFIIWTKR